MKQSLKPIIDKLSSALSELVEAEDDADRHASELAARFCAMTDDGQAQFFVHVARLMGEWPAVSRDNQLHYMGKHLAECKCSTEAAREWIAELAEFVKDAKPVLAGELS